MTKALLDVNVLIALFDPSHINFREAHSWFAARGRKPWATCSVTLDGCIRILSSPGYASVNATPGEVARRLRNLCADKNHEFLADGISLLDEARFDLSRVMGPRQLTDVHLLSLAISNGARLATFDRTIAWRAVKGAEASDVQLLGEPRAH